MAFPSGSVVKNLSNRRHQKYGFDIRVGNIPWRRKQSPTAVFLPGKSHNRRAGWATVHGGQAINALDYFRNLKGYVGNTMCATYQG